jgi:hypothetical protein
MLKLYQYFMLSISQIGEKDVETFCSVERLGHHEIQENWYHMLNCPGSLLERPRCKGKMEALKKFFGRSMGML